MNNITFAEWMKQYHPKEILLDIEYDEYRKDWVEFVGGESKAKIIEAFGDNPDNKDFLNKLFKKHKAVSIKQIIKKTLREDLREEAMSILSIASPFRINELKHYYNEGKGNIVCMHIDTIKEELVFYKLMEQKESDEFGKPRN